MTCKEEIKLDKGKSNNNLAPKISTISYRTEKKNSISNFVNYQSFFFFF